MSSVHEPYKFAILHAIYQYFILITSGPFSCDMIHVYPLLSVTIICDPSSLSMIHCIILDPSSRTGGRLGGRAGDVRSNGRADLMVGGRENLR